MNENKNIIKIESFYGFVNYIPESVVELKNIILETSYGYIHYNSFMFIPGIFAW